MVVFFFSLRRGKCVYVCKFCALALCVIRIYFKGEGLNRMNTLHQN
jgi:hypothetical protein